MFVTAHQKKWQLTLPLCLSFFFFSHLFLFQFHFRGVGWRKNVFIKTKSGIDISLSLSASLTCSGFCSVVIPNVTVPKSSCNQATLLKMLLVPGQTKMLWIMSLKNAPTDINSVNEAAYSFAEGACVTSNEMHQDNLSRCCSSLQFAALCCAHAL